MKILMVFTSHEQLGDTGLRLGAIFEKKKNWDPFTITDGRLITGQNPASSTVTAHALLEFMAAKKIAA